MMEYNLLAEMGNNLENYAVYSCVLFSFALSLGSIYYQLKAKGFREELEKENHNQLE